jgi:hypothetical protein
MNKTNLKRERDAKTFIFTEKPSFAKLWDTCLYNLLYKVSDYIAEIEALFNKIGINKNSKLFDVSAGTGFLSLELAEKGYNVECMDAMDDEIVEFSKKAKEKKLKLKCKKAFWLEIPKNYPKNHFDLALCRGNSFIYAAGGWNKFNKVDSDKSIELYEKTLKIFYDSLKKGGYLYIDKFKDSEIPSKVNVGKAIIEGKKFDLLFYTEINRKKGFRRASMILRDENGKEGGLPNMTYILTLPELEKMLKNVGFKEVKKLEIKNETHFDILLCRK